MSAQSPVSEEQVEAGEEPEAKRAKVDGEEAVDAEAEAAKPDATPEAAKPDATAGATTTETAQPSEKVWFLPDWSKLVMRDRVTKELKFRNKSLLTHTHSVIYSFGVKDETDDLIEIRVLGQFFLYNQIRLMVGAAIGYSLGLYDLEVVQNALDSTLECQFPLAPAEGLALYTGGYGNMDSR